MSFLYQYYQILFDLKGLFSSINVKILYHETAYVDMHFRDIIVQFLVCMLTAQSLVSITKGAQMRHDRMASTRFLSKSVCVCVCVCVWRRRRGQRETT
jgi:hypothetical protein